VGEHDDATVADHEVLPRVGQLHGERGVVPVKAAPGIVDDLRAGVGKLAVDCLEVVAVALPGADFVALAGAIVLRRVVRDDARGHHRGVLRGAAAPASGLAGVAAVRVEVLAGGRAAGGKRGDDGAVADLVVDAGVVGGRVDVDEVAGDATGERRVVPVQIGR